MARNVVITGAASGIGKCTAKAFLALGDRVFLTDWNKENLQATYKELTTDTKEEMVSTRILERPQSPLAPRIACNSTESRICSTVYRIGNLFYAQNR